MTKRMGLCKKRSEVSEVYRFGRMVPKEWYFMFYQVYRFRRRPKEYAICRFFSLGLCITKVHCIAMASVHSAFVNENVFKNIRKNNDTLKIIFSWDWRNKVPCIARPSNRLAEQQHANSHFFRIPILLAFFSAKSANSTVLSVNCFFSIIDVNQKQLQIVLRKCTHEFGTRMLIFKNSHMAINPKLT